MYDGIKETLADEGVIDVLRELIGTATYCDTLTLQGLPGNEWVAKITDPRYGR